MGGRAAPAAASQIELPTLAVAGAIYGSWLLLTAFHAAIPSALLALCGGIVIAWHGSLQHETIHGHPTRLPWLNAAIGAVPLSLWLPYAVYRRTHLAHHATPNITDPFDDPESQYLAGAPGIRHGIAHIERTLIDRLLFGPAIRIAHFLLSEVRRATREPAAVLREWAPHLILVVLLLAWLRHVELPVAHYLLAFVYPGTALSLLRSFAEHRADRDRGARAAIIPGAGPLGLLFLHNNLHAVHHAKPGLPWYRLPAYYRAHRAAFVAGPYYASYWTVARHYLWRPHDSMSHPDHGGRQPAR